MLDCSQVSVVGNSSVLYGERGHVTVGAATHQSILLEIKLEEDITVY